jgi:hypothetical protein
MITKVSDRDAPERLDVADIRIPIEKSVQGPLGFSSGTIRGQEFRKTAKSVRL